MYNDDKDTQAPKERKRTESEKSKRKSNASPTQVHTAHAKTQLDNWITTPTT